MKFTDFLQEASKPKAFDKQDFISSFKDGVFTKNGSHLRVDKYFFFTNKKLTSLKGMPAYIGDDFNCNQNKLTTLEGAPSFVGGKFNCSQNELTSLKGAPKTINGNFDCSHNKLASLKGAPVTVNGDFYCTNNMIISLDGAPDTVDGVFWGYNNSIIKLLGFLRIKKLTKIHIDNTQACDIINKYLPNNRGNDAIYECQNELIDAGFEEEAQL